MTSLRTPVTRHGGGEHLKLTDELFVPVNSIAEWTRPIGGKESTSGLRGETKKPPRADLTRYSTECVCGKGIAADHRGTSEAHAKRGESLSLFVKKGFESEVGPES